MSNFRVIDASVKTEVLDKVRNKGIAVSVLARQYEINARTIYGWLKQGVVDNNKNLILENNKLKKELEIAYRIIGRFTADAQRLKN